MATLSQSEEAQKALEDLQATIELWHKKQKDKIAAQVLILKNMQSLSEKSSAQYIETIADDAQAILDSIKLQGQES